jgi:hypothetical protein
MFKKIFLLIVALISTVIAFTQCKGVRREFLPMGDGVVMVSGDPASIWYKRINAGDTIVLNQKYKFATYFIDKLNGSPSCPIVIINEGGQVQLSGGFNITNCSYLKVTGTGSTDDYGFKVHNPASNDNAGVALAIQGRSQYIEGERIDVYRKTYGMWIKQDPTCDLSLNFPSFVMHHFNIHDIRFKNIGQDCIYAGNTDPLGLRETWCNGVSNALFTYARLADIHLHHLTIDSCNRTGLQLSGCRDGFNEVDQQYNYKMWL